MLEKSSRETLPMRPATLLFWLACLLPLTAIADDTPASSPESALSAYVASAGADFHWEEVARHRLLGTETRLIELASQRWRGTLWRHQLWLIDPTEGRGAPHALLFIGSGTWPAEGEPSREPPRDAASFVALARALETPVAVLRQVPFQPLLGGLTEDALIAETFVRFLDAPEETDWPLLLPMVNSAVRAMDTLQALTADWAAPLETFTLTGASKRGWTTWLTAAVAPRVAALAPMVFDILDMEPQLAHQRRVWGAPSTQIADYTERGIDARLDSDAGRALQAMVDPYRYRERLTQPKLLVLASNDAYWPVDALNLYWHALPEPRHVLYLPNQGHRLRDYARLLPSLAAFHRRVSRGEPLPTLDWTFDCEAERVTLRVSAGEPVDEARAWVARAPVRDFREARWEPHPLAADGAGLALSLPRPDSGYLALFGELQFTAAPDERLTLSTTVQVVDRAAGEATQAGCPAPPGS
ncbi:PhoPQ-activated pathogenicity-related family protein [Halomonas alkalicola]|uniref:PhoPQ-activated protein PqaA family protein n=1 Tax=Halomonas alkalicola TaxID=1930622 RepID=A0ABY9H831_9GAMM|nr:PhoPQ-activated protein PqaA family protein [Halomonas alkalicola]WLI74647.1 PhoPQ-activated protein PqaA family protein [Halomonas alkalicola]